MSHICKFSQCNFESSSRRSFLYHLKNHHKLSYKDYFIVYENKTIKKCLFCDAESSWNIKKLLFNSTCSHISCRGKYAKQNSDKSIKEKYGVKNVFSLRSTIEKTKKTKEIRYGNPNYNNISKNINTCIEKYGVDNVSKTIEIKKKISDQYYLSNPQERLRKISDTFMQNYGVQWNTMNPIIAKKTGESLSITKYGEFIDRIADMGLKIIAGNDPYDILCVKCNKTIKDIKRSEMNISYRNSITPCAICYPYDNYRSKGEKELSMFIQEIYKGEIHFNKKYLNKIDIDIIIPDKKIAFEYNGLYWHSEFKKPKNHHKDKKIELSKLGYNLIHIWEDDWNNPFKKEIIKNRISSILGFNKKIYGRDCKIKEISIKESKEFINKNHLMGYAGASIKIGLFDKNDELIGVSTFGHGRNSMGKKRGYELIRNCYKGGYTIVGGFSKMLNYFIHNYSAEIFSFADTDWTDLNNSVYLKNGFNLIHHTNPSYFWVVAGKRRNRVMFQKHKLIKKGANHDLSESEIMHNLGFYKVYDSGNLRYEYKEKS